MKRILKQNILKVENSRLVSFLFPKRKVFVTCSRMHAYGMANICEKIGQGFPYGAIFLILLGGAIVGRMMHAHLIVHTLCTIGQPPS